MSERVKKVKEDVSLTPRRRSARITQRLQNLIESNDQDSTDNEVTLNEKRRYKFFIRWNLMAKNMFL